MVTFPTNIRFIQEEDSGACSDLVCKILDTVESKFYTPQVIEKWKLHNSELAFLAKENYQLIVFERNGEILGVGAIIINSDYAHISKLYVSPDQHRQGIGKQLLTTLEQIATEAKRNVVHLNATVNARPFYIAKGYSVQGEIRIEQDGISVTYTRMTKQLPHQQIY
jgi:ribosomal protein S18 acetylase RimI-like enzyme